MLVIAVAVSVGAVFALGCQSHDIGQPCELQLGDVDPNEEEENRATTQEVVEQNVSLPCEQLICIATAGRSGYCSKKCREQTGCPAGFECRIVQPVGPFANQKFCAWKQCAKPADCGKKSEFCCVPVEGSAPGEDASYCAFKGSEDCQ